MQGNYHRYVHSGFLELKALEPIERLRTIHLELQKIIQTFQPQEAAIEKIFMKSNPDSALKLGQARGAALVALSVPVSEYSAREIKKAVVGHGGADKNQVNYMVSRLLNIKSPAVLDESDALAIALCHALSRTLSNLLR